MTDLTTPDNRFGHQTPESDIDLFGDAAPAAAAPRTTPWSDAPALPADIPHVEVQPPAVVEIAAATAAVAHTDDDDEEDLDPGDPSAGRKPRNRERAALRRGIAKYDQMLSARPELRAALAAVLRVKDTPRDLTFAVMSGNRAATRAIDDIKTIHGMTDRPLDAIVAAVSIPRIRLRAAWTLLTALDHARGPLPQADVRAGAELMKHASQLTDGDLAELGEILNLSKR
ncbi:hypothetical protein ACFVAJ_16700 [Agromyces sp. NPDC057679]|uniref:hypothetical protein n=1 Tax=Agromyces sp. NPDC057679 TaxID=3346207 RepID=UPI003672E585